MKNKLKVSVGVLLVFIIGTLAGSFGTQYYMKYRADHFMKRGHEARVDFLLGRLSRELDLTEEQKREIGIILTDSHRRLAEISQRYQPEIRGIMDNDFALIRNLLNDEQKTRFDFFQKRLCERGRHRMLRQPLPTPE